MMLTVPFLLLFLGRGSSPMTMPIRRPPAIQSGQRVIASPTPRSFAEAQPHGHRVLIGASIGALGGGVLGFLAGSTIIVGCKAVVPSDCNPGRDERRLRINGALIGAALGAGIGAVVATLWH